MQHTLNFHDSEYLRLVDQVLTDGIRVLNRTKWATIKVFGAQARFNLGKGFPLLTTKKIKFDDIVHELLWIISGSTNIKYLVDNKVSIWTDWPLKFYNHMQEGFGTVLDKKEFEERIILDPDFARTWGELGPVYGKQWRKWPRASTPYTNGSKLKELQAATDEFTGGVIDQLADLIKGLTDDPAGRRHIITAWNPSDIPLMLSSGLPPCHCFFQFNTNPLTPEQRNEHFRAHMVHSPDLIEDFNGHDANQQQRILDGMGLPKYSLDLMLTQRSCDLFLGVPYNIASYSLLLTMVAHVVKMVPNEFIHSYGDLHIYENHVEQMREQLRRGNEGPFYPSPQIAFTQCKWHRAIDDFAFDDIQLMNYQHHPRLSGEVAV